MAGIRSSPVAGPAEFPQIVAYVVGLELAGFGSLGYFEGLEPQTAKWFLAVLAAAPVLWLVRRRSTSCASSGAGDFGAIERAGSTQYLGTRVPAQNVRSGAAARWAWGLALAVALASLVMSCWTGK